MPPTQCGAVLAHDDLHGSDDLLGHRGRHGGGVQGAVGVAAQVVDQLLGDGERLERVKDVFETLADGLESFYWRKTPAFCCLIMTHHRTHINQP